MRFRVKGVRRDTGVSELLIDASNEADARLRAQNDGFSVLSVFKEQQFLPTGRTRRFPLLFLNQELLALLDSGIVLIEVLQTLAEKEARPLVRNVLDRLIDRLREGWTFSDALAEHRTVFPALYIAAIKASEQTGDIAESLRRYIAYQQQMESLKGRVTSALIYPALLISVGGIVILFLMGYVVPSFSHIYEELSGDLPMVSRLLLAWGQLIRDHWPTFLVVTVAFFVLMIKAWRTPAVSQFFAARIWNLPGVGERIRTYQLARFYRTVGMLLRGGIPIVQSLGIVAELLPAPWQPQLTAATRRIREGEAVSVTMDANGLATRVAVRMMRVGERAGNMGEMMERIAAFHDAQISREIEVFTKLFGPILMLIIGAMIGTIVVFMYLPIFQLAESLG